MDMSAFNRGGGGAAAATAPSGGGGWSIGGDLNFGSGSGASGLFGDDPGGAYGTAYQEALRLNQQNYSNILMGYQQTMNAQIAAQNRVTEGYAGLKSDVLSRISGTDAAERNRIADSYAQQIGTANQSLINRGLGNTTVQSAVTRGFTLDKAKADIEAQNRFAQTMAGYESSIGLAGLGYQGQAIGQNTNLANQQLQWMNSVQAPYPDARAYLAAEQAQGARRAGSPGFANTGGGVVGSAGSGRLRSPFQNLGGGGGSISYNRGGGYSAARDYSANFNAAPNLDQIYPSAPQNQMDFWAAGSQGTDYDIVSGGDYWEPSTASVPYDDYSGAPMDGGSDYGDDGWADYDGTW